MKNNIMTSFSNTIDPSVFNYEYLQQDDVCRLCWNKNAEREIISKNIDEACDIKNELADKIRYCLNIDISDINYPNKACESCLEQLQKFYEFKSFCTEVDKRLREIISSKCNNDFVEAIKNSCAVKLEKIDSISEFEDVDFLDSYNDSFHNSDGDNNSETLQKYMTAKSVTKSKYKLRRTPTYCNICRIEFETAINFSNHNSQCHGIEDGGLYKCFGCEKRFKSRKTRLGHEINFCKGLKDGYQCSICDRYLPKRRIYENHMRNHRENIPIEIPLDIFKCVKCFKLFNTKANLSKHMSIHDSEKKNFICEVSTLNICNLNSEGHNYWYVYNMLLCGNNILFK